MPINSQKRPLQRTAALLCAVVAGLGLASGRTAAQVTGPLGTPYTSPPQPTPYQWPTYHSGGGPVPAAQFPVAPSAAAATFLTPLIDPLQSQAQGTPTELYNGALTQIPSYDLGDYDPTRPPRGLNGGGVNFYYPEHLSDGGIYSWAAPFSFIAQTAGAVTVDDTATPPASGTFTSSGFTSISNAVTDPAAGTATNGEYLRALSGSGASAVWTLAEPVAGSYSLYLHIPNDLPNSAGTAEPRSTQVVYSISVRDANGNVTSTSSAAASQTEANDSQFLAGPFQIGAGGTVTVTLLTNGSVNNFSAITPNDYIVADSMTLQQTTGDVQSAPTVITDALYPSDFQSTTHPLQYWGIFVPLGSSVTAGATQAVGTTVDANANPDTTGAVSGGATINGGNILLKVGDPARAVQNDGVTPDTTHLRLIRQLVYFGRSDPSASVSSSVDNSSATGFSGAAVFTPVVNATASNGQYVTYPTLAGTVTAASTPVATWTVPVPGGGAASYFVYAHIPATPTGETRSSSVYYTVTVNGVPGPVLSISQKTQGTDALIVLPTGPLSPAVGSNIVVKLYSQNATTPAVVAADSITVTTGTGQGAIYCVDGFTGSVVWRFETPGSANGPSSPVFSSPTVAKINILVTPAVVSAGGIVMTPAVYANKLVVIAGDNNGLVYCLDAIGNGDGTSNANVIDPASGQPILAAQPTYGVPYTSPLTAAAGTSASTFVGTPGNVHVGTTGVYWIYRPDASQPKYVSVVGTTEVAGTVKPIDPTSDVPVPAAFATASPAVFVDPTRAGANAVVYIGNSNGVLYALNASGGTRDVSKADGSRDGFSFQDPYNVSQNLGAPFAGVPSAQPLWWFSLRGPGPNSGTTASNADIESAPALYVRTSTTGGVTTYLATVYIGSAHELETTSNVGRLYALDGLYGPSSDNGRISPLTQPDPTLANYTGPGSFNYNVGQIPQTSKTDTSDWSFPDANLTATGPLAGFVHASSNGLPRPALGNITGSPVVFTNIDEPAVNTNADGSPRQTRIYIAANSGLEYPATVRPDDTQTGRIWAVNLDGTVGSTTKGTVGTNTTSLADGVWSYPLAYDPNDKTKDGLAEPYAPIGSFLRATPAIGFVQYPAVIDLSSGGSYSPVDAVHTALKGNAVPMLYVGTQGVNDTALYAVDIDGGMITPAGGATTNDQRTIYRVVSPDGSIFQASPALVANATSPTSGGNGGAIYAVAGNTLYDYSATPISNPFTTDAFPLIREDRAYTGFGPISSPAIAGADTTDLSQTFLNSGVGAVGITDTSGFHTNTTDWIYVGDSTSGLCRGITPNDPSYGGIATDLGVILPPPFNPPPPILLNALIQTFLVTNQTDAVSSAAKPVGVAAPLPVYEWGESAYARFTNVAPPNPTNSPSLFVYDTNTYTNITTDATNASPTSPIPFYTSDGSTAQTVTFNLADADAGVKFIDSGSVNPRVVTTPPDGFVKDTTTLAGATPAFPANVVSVVENLQTTAGDKYLGTYTYTIADGTARNNTPGGRRRFQNVRQTVTEWDFTNKLGDGDLTNIDNYVNKGPVTIGGDATNNNIVPIFDKTTGQYTFTNKSLVPAIDQPTFGVLNPLAVRGGGVDLLHPNTNAVEVGDEAGPFRGVMPPPTLKTTGGATGITPGGDYYALQALANGNDRPNVAPPSSSGVGLNPTILPNPTNNTDATGVNSGTTPMEVVTTTGLIPHNTTGDNHEPSTTQPIGDYSNITSDGLLTTEFDGHGLNLFDRGALFNLGQILRVKLTVPTSPLAAPPTGSGVYWNSNFGVTNLDTTFHDSVVNFLPWETAPTPYLYGGNSSLDYPDIPPGNVTQEAIPISGSPGGDLTSNYVTLPPATPFGQMPVHDRKVYGDPVQIQISIPNHQPANQQLYQQTPMTTGQTYSGAGEVPPVTEAGGNLIASADNVFPMGYVTTKRVYVPNASGFYSRQRPYRDVRVYTGVPVDMRTSIVNPTTDIGKVPAAFGVQTELYPGLNPATATVPTTSNFTPYNPAFQNYFKPLEVHNDGNVNLLNVHLDQKIGGSAPLTLRLNSDVTDPLSNILGFDLPGITGPRSGAFGTSGSPVPEQPYLIRTSLDSDLVSTYDRNPALSPSYYPGATFHKPTAGGNQPSILSVPDSPESNINGASLNASPNGLPTTTLDATNGNLPYSAPPFVSIAMPFGTPVGTYTTSAPQDIASLRLFEGIDTQSPNGFSLKAYPTGNPNIPSFLYPPVYGGAVGGIGTPTAAHIDTSPATNTGQPLDSSATPQPEDIYSGFQPLSATGTQLTGTVVEQRLTDGATYGAVPMIDLSPQGTGAKGTPDFAPAAFRDPVTGSLSVYWTSGRGTGYGIYGAAVPFTLNPAGNSTGQGYFYPADKTQYWWLPNTPTLQTGTNSGLSIVPAGTADYAFAVNVGSTAPYTNTLYSYGVTPATGIVAAGGARITPPLDDSQVKYGVKGLYTGFTNPLWAFWTASTRGRTALYYNSERSNGFWNETVTVLPVPAGLTSVADASPLLMPITVGTASSNQIEVTYSGTSPDGKTDLYVSRYQPDGTTAPASSKLDLVAFPATTENLTAANGWYQARDVAWSRTGALNLFVNYAGGAQTSLLYNGNTPLFTKAIFDKASGLLVLTGVQVPNGAGAQPPHTTNTVYVDAATGRIRFSPALMPATQNFAQIRATFSPTAHRLTTGTDSRANTGPVTFLDQAQKANDTPGGGNIEADRRWTIWRKSSAANDTASSTLYYKTQRLTFFVPTAIDPTKSVTVTLGGTATTNYDLDYERGRFYFPIATGAEGETAAVTYTDPAGTAHNIAADTTGQNTVQWQDEILANNNDVPILDSAAGLDIVTQNAVPIDTAVNENNVAAFLDPFAGKIDTNGVMNPHKVWLFWNSTRNGTADIYSETIDPRFSPGP